MFWITVYELHAGIEALQQTALKWNKNKTTIYMQRIRRSNNTFIGGYLWYGAVPVASSMAVIPKLQMSALKL